MNERMSAWPEWGWSGKNKGNIWRWLQILLIILTLPEVWIGLNWFHAPIANSTPVTFDQLVKLLYTEGAEQ